MLKSFKWSLEGISISQTTGIVIYIIIHDNSFQCFSYLQELTFLIPIGRIKGVLNLIPKYGQLFVAIKL